jgi:ribosomal RNA-processing protein 9
MPDPFLALPGAKRKRASKPDRRNGPAKGSEKKAVNRRNRGRTPESDSDEVGGEISDVEVNDLEESGEESEYDETPAEKRLRLAKQYLETVQMEVGNLLGNSGLMTNRRRS